MPSPLHKGPKSPLLGERVPRKGRVWGIKIPTSVSFADSFFLSLPQRGRLIYPKILSSMAISWRLSSASRS